MDPRLEERYIVVKIKDISDVQAYNLRLFMRDWGIPTRDCVVVEQDWPEYKPTVDAIIKRLIP